nr:hypothetical protein [Oryctes rhinoceros nudivirus]
MLRSLHSHIRGVYMRTPMACRIRHPTTCRFWHATLATLAYTRSLYENANGLSYSASYDLSFLACYSRIYEDFMRTEIDCRIWHPTSVRFWHATPHICTMISHIRGNTDGLSALASY